MCKLKKTIYGLKQASRQWNKTFTDCLKSFGLLPLASDSCVFTNKKSPTEDALIMCICVDDGLVIGKNKQQIALFIKQSTAKFEITIIKLDTYVGFQIKMSHDGIMIHQRDYIEKVLEKFEMCNSRSVSTPLTTNVHTTLAAAESDTTVEAPYRQLIGSLLYASLLTRPDITHAVSLLSRFCESPKLAHWTNLKRILRYLRDKTNMGLRCQKQQVLEIVAYSDADHGGCTETRRSTSEHLILLCATSSWPT